MKVSFILGAGFSVPAGLPLAKDIWPRLADSEIEKKTLCFDSSEWKWAEFANSADRVNGGGNTDRLRISLCLKYLVEWYKADKSTDEFNYEFFYDWINKLDQRDAQWQALQNRVITEIQSNSRYRYTDTGSISLHKVLFCLVHLIDDLLWVRKKYHEYSNQYEPYLELIRDSKNEISIFTLNHDLLVEKLMTKEAFFFSDGFSIKNSRLRDPYGNAVKIFDGSFTERIKLFKLHGSIDQHRYYYADDTDKFGQYDYFKTLDCDTKHATEYIDNKGTIRQRMTIAIEPQLVTGRNKLQLINNDRMYNELYSAFEKELPNSDLLVISGYSFSDSHVEAVIKKSIGSISEIVNINPDEFFPHSHHKIRFINPINERVSFF